MALEVIKQIRLTEQQADECVRNAQQQAAKILDEARRDGESAAEEIRAQPRDKIKEIETAALGKAEAVIRTRASEASKAGEKLKADARTRVNEAVRYSIERICKSWR